MPGTGMLRGWAAVVVAAAVLIGLMTVSVPAPVPTPAPHMPDRVLGQPPETVVSPPDSPRLNSVSAAPREEQLQALLRRRAEAMRSRDETAFLASVDPKAPAEFKQRERALFHNLAGVPLAEWTYEPDFASVLASPPVPEPAEEAWTPRVTLSYALSGVDTVPTRRPLGYTFVRRDGSWYLAGDNALPARGRATGPWDFGPSRVVSTDAGLVIGHQRNRNLMDRVARALDSSVATVTDVWGPDWSRRVGVLLPESHEELRAMVGSEFAVQGIAAVAVADRVDTAARRVEGPRIVLNPQTAGQLSDQALRVVLQHEITHIAARADTKDGAPMWMLEGFADYVGYRDSTLTPQEIAPDLGRQLRESGAPGGLPADGDFSVAGRRLDVAYQQSWSLLDFLVRRLGEPRVVQLYQRIARSGSPATVDSALREVAGMSTADLIAGWSEDLHRALG